MTATVLFKSKMIEWLCKNNCSNVDIFFDEQFGYAIYPDSNERGIGIGIFTSPTTLAWYKQFLYEYGDTQIDILDIVLPFLHEMGHHFTLDNFDQFELAVFNLSKMMTCEENAYLTQEQYWVVPDEMSANVWAMNFIKTHIEAVEELNKIFYAYWDDMCNELCEL